jgi:hypothetical protein
MENKNLDVLNAAGLVCVSIKEKNIIAVNAEAQVFVNIKIIKKHVKYVN